MQSSALFALCTGSVSVMITMIAIRVDLQPVSSAD